MKKYLVRIGCLAAAVSTVAVGFQMTGANAATGASSKCTTSNAFVVHLDKDQKDPAGSKAGTFCKGAADLSKILGGKYGDKISSATNNTGKYVGVYEHANYCGQYAIVKPGGKLNYTGSSKTLGDKNFLNDNISSIKVDVPSTKKLSGNTPCAKK